MRDLSNRVAVVTGAASGIGFSLAKRFADQGMKLVLADIDADALDWAEKQFADAEVFAVKTDVSKFEEVEALAAAVLERYGAVHVVCNNAGIFSPPGFTWEHTQQDWDRNLNVNLWGVINGIRAFMPILLDQNTEAHVVNVASLAGVVIDPCFAPYHASKFGVVAVSESLKLELEILKNTNIGVSVACPGFVRTSLLEGESGFENSESENGVLTPLRSKFKSGFNRGLEADEVAEQINQAIIANRFYVFTHSFSQELLRHRMDALYEGRNPSLSEETRAFHEL